MLANVEQPLETRIEQAYGKWALCQYGDAIRDLLIILGDEDTSVSREDAIERQIEGREKTRIAAGLQTTYDWSALVSVIASAPRTVDPKNGKHYVSLQDLFNLLDMHITTNLGFRTADTKNEYNSWLPLHRLIAARNVLKLLFLLFHTVGFHELIQEESEKLDPYKQFAEALYEIVKEEGLRFESEGKSLVQRDFYLFSHSFISLNWDPILLWLIFNTHKRHNDNDNTVPRVASGNTKVPLKMFHDLGHFMGVRQIRGETPDVWYPFNETIVHRLNDPDHETDRRVRVGKFYFPHGCSSWRECPNCGKLVMVLGDEWKEESYGIFPPLPIKQLGNLFGAKSIEEQTAQGSGRWDAIQCPFCGTITETKDVPLIMQSSFKGHHPSFLEEIQRDMRVSLEGAKHIVLFGYSLPPDDVIYRSLLAARKNRREKVYCSVVVGLNQEIEDGWLVGPKLQRQLDKHPNSDFAKAVNSASAIFGFDNVRGFARGIPNVFYRPGTTQVDKENIKILLYPETFNGQDLFPGHKVDR